MAHTKRRHSRALQWFFVSGQHDTYAIEKSNLQRSSSAGETNGHDNFGQS